MDDLDLRLEVYQGHANHCVTFAISRKPLEMEAIGSKGPPIGNGLANGVSDGHVTDDVT